MGALKDFEIEIEFEKTMQILGEKFGFDWMSATLSKPFVFQFVGEALVKCEPYKLALPVGRGVLYEEKLYSIPGQFWGNGLYDRCQWDERFFNDMQRSISHAAKQAAQTAAPVTSPAPALLSASLGNGAAPAVMT